MAFVRDYPLLTQTFDTPSVFVPQPDSLYIFRTLSNDERTDHLATWRSRANHVDFASVIHQDSDSFTVEHKGQNLRLLMRSEKQLLAFWKANKRQTVYIDITGLDPNVWTPLIRTALLQQVSLKAVYVEPADYKHSATPTEGELFDLSTEIEGIRPLPGFASLAEVDDDNVCFIPLLGFQGTRLGFVLEQVQPADDKILPIVGVPGFRPEYAFYAFHSNREPLVRNRSWKNMHFVTANCPFSLFYKLQEIAAEYPRHMLKVALIGTKPHELGAVLYALLNPKQVELVYDNPITKTGTTIGFARLLLYNISSLASSGMRS